MTKNNNYGIFCERGAAAQFGYKKKNASVSCVSGASCSKAGKEGLNTGVNNQPSNSIKIHRQLNKDVIFYSRPSKL